FARRPVTEQARMRAQLDAVVAVTSAELAPASRIVLEASDGIAVVVLADPAGALRLAERAMAAVAAGLPLSVGINHGAVQTTRSGARGAMQRSPPARWWSCWPAAWRAASPRSARRTSSKACWPRTAIPRCRARSTCAAWCRKRSSSGEEKARADRPLQDPRRARSGRDGHRLPRRGSEPRSHRRAKDHAPERRRRRPRGLPQALF